MNHKDFNKLLINRQREERDVLVTKAGEYANDDERFANFINAAAFMASGQTPEAACWNFMAKHLVAARDGINKIELGAVMPMEFWVEKLGDIRNYCILLEGLIVDRLQEVKK